MSHEVIYLDHNSTTPVDKRVVDKMLPFFTRYYGNASSKTHAYGWEAKEAVDLAREQLANFVKCEPAELFFTSGSTEAINTAIRGTVSTYRQKGQHIISCKTEHNAVLETLYELEKEGITITWLEVNHEGMIDPDDLYKAIRNDTILVCLMFANNETGTIHPVQEFGRICKEKKVLFFCDATQAAGKIRIDIAEIQCDLLCLSAHKMYGPKGVGLIYKRRRNPSVKLTPLITGGGQENGLRAGTLNVPGIVGFGHAAFLAGEELWEEAARLSRLRTIFEQMLEAELPVSINGSIRSRLPNTTNICFHGIQASRLIATLPRFAFSTGSACTSALPEPSHVLKAMGFSDLHSYSSVRFSLGRTSSKEELFNAAREIINEVQRLKA